MSSAFHRLTAAATLCALFATSTAFALPFGISAKDKAASAKVTRGGPFKGQSSYALGAFRVAFITEDSVAAVAKGMLSGGNSAASRMSGELTGVDHALMQKITDQIYADFLKQAPAKGLTLIDSATLAKSSPSYAAMDEQTSFDEGRLGTYVIPTGQRSVPLAADGSKQLGKGSKGLTDSFRITGQMMAKAPANKEFPKASKESGATVLGVTLVVNFANFKGSGTSSWGSSAKTRIISGATIDGWTKADALPATSIMGWDPKTPDAPMAMGEVILEGQVHSEASIGSLDSHSDMKVGDHIANGIAALGGGTTYSKKAAVVTADPVAYEKNVLLVAAEASDILLSAIAKEK